MPFLLDGLRILLLEDEALIAMDVEQLCRDNGASEVTIARCLAEIDGQNVPARFDAVVIDLMLDGVSTLDFARDLFDRKVPIVFASGYSDETEIETDFPGVALIGKPYAGADLIGAVAASCGRLISQLAGDPIT